MNSPSVQSLSLNELFQLVHFYAEAGVEWMLEDAPQDRFAEFAAMEAARAAPREPPRRETAAPQAASASPRQAARPAAAPVRPAAVVPDAEAVSEARRVAAEAATLDDLALAVAAFGGCNLRNSARSTAFLTGNVEARIAIAGGLPSADDDRDGQPFSGPAGAMLEKMLAGIGIRREDVLQFNIIPWRPPGNRAPTPHELDICRPFGLRALELLKPNGVLALGNLPARFFSGSNETIHGLRGRWMEVEAGNVRLPVMTTFHPQDLMAAPPCKRLAWQDLLDFRAKLIG